MEAYLTCIQGEYDAKVAAEANATAEQKAEMARVQDQKHNAAVQEVQRWPTVSTSSCASGRPRLPPRRKRSPPDRDSARGGKADEAYLTCRC